MSASLKVIVSVFFVVCMPLVLYQNLSWERADAGQGAKARASALPINLAYNLAP